MHGMLSGIYAQGGSIGPVPQLDIPAVRNELSLSIQITFHG